MASLAETNNTYYASFCSFLLQYLISLDLPTMKFLCPVCRLPLSLTADQLECANCDAIRANVRNGVVEFLGCTDKESFFEKQALERLDGFYAGYTPEVFEEVLRQIELWQMDWANKRVGVSRKFWWEPHIGRISGKSILEIGCGVNYLVPFFLRSHNRVFAFDICRGSVDFLCKVVRLTGVPTDALDVAVADATKLELGESFDIIDINNVLHHIGDKPAVFERAYRHLKDDGQLIIVEPNYYYPPRWIIETDVFDPFNFIKEYFVRNDLIEKGEKAIVFSCLRQQLKDAGFKIDKTFEDPNFLGYFTQYWIRENTLLAKSLFQMDKLIFSKILPMAVAPFQYIIASKAS